MRQGSQHFVGWRVEQVNENDHVYRTSHLNDDPSAQTKTLSGTYNRLTGALDATATFSSPLEDYTVRYTGSLASGELCVIDMHNSENHKCKGRGIVVIEEKY
ncbi:hypothetical protein Pelo_14719 [Pelomyxa schiedti]|nr:hypothetical protein Pelo_14719 [Pelomyxa schiedti]